METENQQTGKDLSVLVREQIVAHVWKPSRTVAEAAAEITERMVAGAMKAAKGKQESRMVVRRACRGTITGLLNIGKNDSIPETAVSLLKSMAKLAEDFGFLPSDMMTWCMEGIADTTVLTGPELAGEIQKKIEAEFLGTDGIFQEFCQKAIAKNWWTK